MPRRCGAGALRRLRLCRRWRRNADGADLRKCRIVDSLQYVLGCWPRLAFTRRSGCCLCLELQELHAMTHIGRKALPKGFARAPRVVPVCNAFTSFSVLEAVCKPRRE